MLLPNRPSVSLRAILSAAALTILLVFTFNYYFFSSLSRESYTNPFGDHDKTCADASELVALISQNIQAPTVTVTAPPRTLTVFPQTPSPITVTKTVHVVPGSLQTPKPLSIPSKLWYKLGPKGLSSDAKEWIDSCLNQNQHYRHEFMTDASGDHFVKTHYAHRPDIVHAFLSLPIPILKADFLRYLILFSEGGIWSDLDVSCEEGQNITIDNWIPKKYEGKVGLVVGLEFDFGWEDDDNLRSQFASWTIVSMAGSPHMLMAVEDIMESIHTTTKENNCTVEQLTQKMIGDVVDFTGPKRMTRSVVKSLAVELAQTIDDRNISQLHEPRLVGDVLVLPGNAFAASQNGYPEDQGPRLVTHHYAGSWKNDHGGEMA